MLQLQFGALWHRVVCTNPVGSKSTFPPSVLVAWPESTEVEPQRHINKIEAVVPAICLCTWPDLIRGSLWLHFIDNDGALACLISGCSKNSLLSAVIDVTWHRFLSYVVGHGLNVCHQSATSSMACLEGISPPRRTTIGYVIRRSCLSLS